MDAQKKQKLIIGVLAVAVLGAGTFYWVNSKSGASKSAQANTGPIQRRKRKEPATVDKGPTRRERDASKRRNSNTAPKMERRVKKDSENKKIDRRRKVRRGGRKTKKVEREPLG